MQLLQLKPQDTSLEVIKIDCLLQKFLFFTQLMAFLYRQTRTVTESIAGLV
jgi:hypothetical protein